MAQSWPPSFHPRMLLMSCFWEPVTKFTSVTRNYIDKPEADGALILPPPKPSLHHCYVLRVVNATQLKLHRKERNRDKDLRSHLGIEIEISSTEGRALTDFPNPCSSSGCTKVKSCLFIVKLGSKKLHYLPFLRFLAQLCQ